MFDLKYRTNLNQTKGRIINFGFTEPRFPRENVRLTKISLLAITVAATQNQHNNRRKTRISGNYGNLDNLNIRSRQLKHLGFLVDCVSLQSYRCTTIALNQREKKETKNNNNNNNNGEKQPQW